MGNLNSVAHALDYLDVPNVFVREGAALDDVSGIVLPGVGAFGEAMHRLDALDLIEPLTAAVIDRKAPVLGICLGMQIMAESSSEGGHHAGLGWIGGTVERLEVEKLKLPHVGWNDVAARAGEILFENTQAGAHFYFDHTYSLRCADDLVVATVNYERPVVAAVRLGNIFATQFHPEKSQRQGLRLLRNFTNQVFAC